MLPICQASDTYQKQRTALDGANLKVACTCNKRCAGVALSPVATVQLGWCCGSNKTLLSLRAAMKIRNLDTGEDLELEDVEQELNTHWSGSDKALAQVRTSADGGKPQHLPCLHCCHLTMLHTPLRHRKAPMRKQQVKEMAGMQDRPRRTG